MTFTTITTKTHLVDEMGFGRKGGIRDNYVIKTISDIKADNAAAGDEIDNVRQQSSGAAANATETLGIIERNKSVVEQNTGTILECRELVG